MIDIAVKAKQKETAINSGTLNNLNLAIVVSIKATINRIATIFSTYRTADFISAIKLSEVAMPKGIKAFTNIVRNTINFIYDEIST
jgi:hypothetical protein